MRLFAFAGTRYASRREGDDPGAHAAPPYDQIDAGRQRELHAADPHQFAHLSRPAPPAGAEPAGHAAALHRAWQREGVLLRDPEPGLYPYEIELAGGGRRLGFFGLVGLEEPSAGVIRPHEQTLTKTVAERLELLRRMEVDLGPVLLLAEDGGAIDELLSADLATATPLAEHRDEYSHGHRLFRISAPDRVEAYRSALAAAAGLIADGHHRYKTARLYAEESGAAAGTAAAAKLCAITSLASPALTIEPIHRALATTLPGLDHPAIVARESWPGASGSELARAVAAAAQPAIGVSSARGTEIWRLDPATGPDDLPAAASELAVVLLHHTLLPAWGFAADAATDGTVLYRSDPDQLLGMLGEGSVGTGLFLPPMSTSGFAAAIADGDVLPPKSTRFMPKVISGLVWAEHDGRLG